ncbi:CopG family ribbon-helix-helix protein [Allopusillimonas ginsengisoli]|uniref:CopG family ribbon-helix-helix protein n=1 Tax=Allopusillimonas ginsengisoli TaxID=453575 RepID=UPI0039C2E88A
MATSLKIDDELKGRVQQLAGWRRRSPHWIMLEAVRQYVEREEARESFKQEALASWAAYKETGRHLTGQEVRTWLNTWGTDEEEEEVVPECHK